MSKFGHYEQQYWGNKIKFPIESFLIAGISHYQKSLGDIPINTDIELFMELEPDNIHDKTAIRILYDNNKIGYVPNKNEIKKLCLEELNEPLIIINLKREKETINKNFGIRVIPKKYYNEDMKYLSLF